MSDKPIPTMLAIVRIDGSPIVWTDKKGVTHFCEGAEFHPGIFVLWTRCGQHDIPGDAAWKQRPEDIVACADCIQASKDYPNG